MGVKLSGGADATRRRKQLNFAIRQSLRELSIQLSVLNHRVGAHLDLNDVDLACLDLVARHGPLSPSALARRAGMHPATMTGILDRLERGGWVARGRDPSDRRAVVVKVLRRRIAEVIRLYA
ncbi:MAG TPA: MarR family transcriptional regulator, partial [Candidatus Binatus sp.]|nr:MarR family transcriptional regulator [Candidatus Binatus sp.]